MKKVILSILAICVMSALANAESCTPVGATDKKYTPSGCDYKTETRTCCEDGNWSEWNKDCPKVACKEDECLRDGKCEKKLSCTGTKGSSDCSKLSREYSSGTAYKTRTVTDNCGVCKYSEWSEWNVRSCYKCGWGVDSRIMVHKTNFSSRKECSEEAEKIKSEYRNKGVLGSMTNCTKDTYPKTLYWVDGCNSLGYNSVGYDVFIYECKCIPNAGGQVGPIYKLE